jgi:hypothetical protein
MLLLGVHTPADGGSRRFLLQNWWPQKQFIECSEGYLDACGVQAVFVCDGSMIPDTLPLLDGVWAEAADVEHGEAYDLEG